MSPHPALEAEENFATTAVLQCTRAVCCWWGLLSLLFPAGAVCSRCVCYWCRLPSASTSILGFAPASYTILLAPSTISCQINVLLSLTVYPAGIKFLRSEETCSGRGTWHPVCCQVGAAAPPKEGWCCARQLLYRCDNSLPATDPIRFSSLLGSVPETRTSQFKSCHGTQTPRAQLGGAGAHSFPCPVPSSHPTIPHHLLCISAFSQQ